MGAAVTTPGDRRHDARRPVDADSVLSRARFIGGGDARVRDVSTAGVLVVTAQRVAPGMSVYLQFPGVAWLPRQRGAVARCFVARLCGEQGVEYGVGVRLAAAIPELRELASRPG
jgi:hypothetical protein